MSTTLAPSRTAHPSLYDQNERRVDGRDKVSGQADYTADFSMPGMLWAAFVPGTLPHARIVRIDTSAAREMKGVHAVLTGADIGERFLGRRLFDWPVLAYEKVRFVGEYVAAVAAETPEIAEAAAAAIDVEYEELEPLFDPRAALAPGAQLLHPDREKYPFVPPKPVSVPHPNMQGYTDTIKGDPAAAFARADRVFEHEFTTPRYHAGYIEPHAAMVWIDGNGVVHVLATHKGPFSLRDALALSTGVPKEKIVVEASFIGGEFGAKGISVEVFPTYYLAQAAKRPVKYVRSYLDDIRSTTIRHASTTSSKIGVSKDGKIVALELRTLYDGGAYAAGKVIPTILPGQVPKLPYRIDDVRCERIAAYTNTIPGGFVRAPGDVQILFALESHLDMVARELGIDPLEFRLRNAIADGETDVDGNPIADPHVKEILLQLRDTTKWNAPLPAGRGRGVALVARHIGGGTSNVALTAHADGSIQMDVGVAEPGVGTLTIVQRVVAGELGLDPARIGVTRGATNVIPFDPGIGGSRSTHIVGQASLDAARKLRAALEAAGGSADGGWDRALAALAKDGPYKIVGTYSGDHKHGEPEFLNFGGYVVEVSVDHDTGTVRIDDVTFVMEVGTIINPIAHRGQIDGAFMMGLGHAVTEELVVEDGRIVNLNLGEYKLPTQMDMPPCRVAFIQTPGGPGPYGARAAGEVNVAAVAPAIANAVADACGARIDALPITAERVFAALND
jgi:CO/xanthine dehydrogenase Mo-binding subunit